MKLGKVSLNILNRSVLKVIQEHKHKKNGAAVGNDCAIVALSEEKREQVAITTDPITIPGKEWAYLGVYKAVANLIAGGAVPKAISVALMVPAKAREVLIKRNMEHICQVCEELGVELVAGHTEVTNAVNHPVAVFTGIGTPLEGVQPSDCDMKAQMDIVCTKWIGLEGSVILATCEREKILTRYPERLAEEVLQYEKYFSVQREGQIAQSKKVVAMHDISQGGVFGALYEMTEKWGFGIDIDLKKIPVKQETVEICELFGLNPYTLLSGGSLLMLHENGEELVESLTREGINATVIGKTTDSHDKIIRNGEEIRYLDVPQTDDIFHHFYPSDIEDTK